MPRVTSTEPLDGQENMYLYKRISLEFLSQWPGVAWLRLEPYNGPVVMIQVLPGDIASIGRLGEPV